MLRYYLELSESEIASTLGISNGSVKSHASRGLAALGEAPGGTRMKIEERLHDAMHEYADGIEPEPGSWSAISARFDETLPTARTRPSRRPLVLAGVALTVVVVLIAALVVRDDGDDETRVVTGPVAAMPGRILAITVDGSAGGPRLEDVPAPHRLRHHDRIAAATQIAVTPDGESAYAVQGKDKDAAACSDHSIVQLPLGADAAPNAEVPTIAARATEPTVSPDGRYLAYLRCSAGNERAADEMVLRDLATGTESVKSAPAGTGFAYYLQFGSDSRHVYFNFVNDSPGGVDTRVLDLVGGEDPPGTLVADGGSGWAGVRGTTGEFLGLRPTEPGDVREAAGRRVAPGCVAVPRDRVVSGAGHGEEGADPDRLGFVRQSHPHGVERPALPLERR